MLSRDYICKLIFHEIRHLDLVIMDSTVDEVRYNASERSTDSPFERCIKEAVDSVDENVAIVEKQRPSSSRNSDKLPSDQYSSEDIDILDVDDVDDVASEELSNVNEPSHKKKLVTIYSINVWTIIKRASINLIFPFINGMMLGFGEILAHEIGFKFNWAGARVYPQRRYLYKKENTSSRFL